MGFLDWVFGNSITEKPKTIYLHSFDVLITAREESGRYVTQEQEVYVVAYPDNDRNEAGRLLKEELKRHYPQAEISAVWYDTTHNQDWAYSRKIADYFFI